ncbi:hypothetical protein ACI0FN_00947 [Alcaligenes nematophilus]|nr:Uncharacterised protein [Alcaligenes faecalis subsp. faecalis]
MNMWAEMTGQLEGCTRASEPGTLVRCSPPQRLWGSICTQTVQMLLVSLSLDRTQITEAAACNLQAISAAREIAGVEFCRPQVFIDFKARK